MTEGHGFTPASGGHEPSPVPPPQAPSWISLDEPARAGGPAHAVDASVTAEPGTRAESISPAEPATGPLPTLTVDTEPAVFDAPPADVIVVGAQNPVVPSIPVQRPGGAELDARGVSAWFGSALVLAGVSLTMRPRTVTALIGPSGCGKSTFLRTLNRMHELVPSAQLAGEVLLNGEDIYAPGRRITETRKRIGMVFQKPNPFPAMSIGQNVVAGLKLAGIKMSSSDKSDLIEESLRRASLWTEVKDRLDAPGGGLSGGQQQRLCIARSLAVQPDVLLMDEPCSALDPTSTLRVEETIHALRDEVTIVIVTHNMQQAQRVSQQCAFFLAAQGTPGGIVEAGDTLDIFNNPQDSRTADYVGGRFG